MAEEEYEYEYEYYPETGDIEQDWINKQTSKVVEYDELAAVDKQRMDLVRHRAREQMDFFSLDRANINNTNNIKNDKDIKTFNDITPWSDNQELVCSAPLVPASQEERKASSQKARGIGSTAPWSHLKIDLFDNATEQQTVKGVRQFKLKLGFVYPDKPNQSLSAGLNHAWRFVKRGFDFNDSDDLAHYNLLEQLYQTAKDEYSDVRASKCYDNIRGQKGRSIIGISVILCQMADPGEYYIILIDGKDCYDITLTNKNLTLNQQKNNCVASGSMGTATTLPKLKARDFHSRGTN
jgi:hypothetical protein